MIKKILPVLPLRDIVVFPYMVAPLFVGRKQSVNALNSVMTDDKKIRNNRLNLLGILCNQAAIIADFKQIKN